MGGYVILGHRTLKSAIPQPEINWWIELIFACWKWWNNFWLEHESCPLSLAINFWGSTVVILHCNYLLRCLLNFGAPQSLSHGQYCSVFPNLHFSMNSMLPLVNLNFPWLILFYFSVSCSYWLLSVSLLLD